MTRCIVFSHLGPINQLAWSHPSSGDLLASVGQDGMLRVWKEVQQNHWQCVYRHQAQSALRAVQFAPAEYGIMLTTGGLDGKVTVVSYLPAKQAWTDPFELQAHDSSINGISWAPAVKPCLLKAERVDLASEVEQAPEVAVQRFTTCGNDGRVKVWAQDVNSGELECVANLGVGEEQQGKTAHDDQVSDVAWRSYSGSLADMIVSVGADQRVRIWKSDQPVQASNNQFKRQW